MEGLRPLATLTSPTPNCGFAAEIATAINESGFHLLDAPVHRLTAPDVPVPFAKRLEDRYRPAAEDIVLALRDLIEL